jgi:hypothetical protein
MDKIRSQYTIIDGVGKMRLKRFLVTYTVCVTSQFTNTRYISPSVIITPF